MGEEVKMTDYGTPCVRGGGGGSGSGGGSDDRFLGWEVGLPSDDDLTPLSQCLIPLELASAFSITPEPCRTVMDVNRASKNTLSTIRGGSSQGFSSNNFKCLDDDCNRDPMTVEADEEVDRDGSASDSRKLRKVHSTEEADSALRTDNPTDDPSARTLKRPRLVWTPQLHKRFVDVVAHLGIKNAVPKTIMRLMNVEGLTRENVASHLQKYRLYLKRIQGLSNDGPSSSDQLFASMPVPQSLHESDGNGHTHINGHMPMPIPMPYPPMNMVPMPVLGMNHGHGHSHSHSQARMGVTMNNPNGPVGFPGFEAHQYSMMQQSDWSGNNFGSVMSYPHHVAPND